MSGRKRRPLGEPIVYPIEDEHGELIAEHVRTDFEEQAADGTWVRGKAFVWRRNGKLGLGGLKTAELPLYRIREALKAGGRVVVVEGEKPCDELWKHGIPAVATVTGRSGTPSVRVLAALKGLDVILWADADTDGGGAKHMDRIGAALHEVARSVRVLSIEGSQDGDDAHDYFARGGKREDVLRRLGVAPEWKPPAESTSKPSRSRTGVGKEPTQAEKLIAIAYGAELFRSADESAFATIFVNGHAETWRVRSDQFRRWLLRQFFSETGKAAGGQAVEDGLRVIESRASFDGECLPIAVRLAEHETRIYLDLADERWRAVEVGPDGWRVVDRPPVRFLRPRGMAPLPLPVSGGTIEELRPFVNITLEAD